MIPKIKDYQDKLLPFVEVEQTDDKIWKARFKGQNEEYQIIIEKNDLDIYKLTTQPVNIQEEDQRDINFFISQIDEMNSKRSLSNRDGVEDEDEDTPEQDWEKNPYDPEKIRVETKNFSVDQIFAMMTEYNEIDLSPDFQRQFVWLDKKRKSRLIESIMLRIPLPVFYFSELENGQMQVIDGVQRLTVIKDFLSGKFKLSKLEYLKKLNGKCFPTEKGVSGEDILDPKFVRRIRQTQLVVNIIDPQSPNKVKYDIFKRINSGGKQLNTQEIRNCMARPESRNLIRDMANSDEFKGATGNSVNDTRMAAQKLVMRFIGFYYLKKEKYEGLKYSSDIEGFLDDSLEILNKSSQEDRSNIRNKFRNAMENAQYLFGEYAFRKILSTDLNNRKPLINKSLFTTWSVVLSSDPAQKVKQIFTQEALLNPLIEELLKKKEYYEAISLGTNSKSRLETAFMKAEKLFCDALAPKDI